MSANFVKLVDYAENGSKSIIGGPFGSKLTTKDYVSEGIPVLRGSNLAEGKYIDEQDHIFVSEEKASRDLFSNTASRGDLIFTQRGTLGQVAIIPETSAYPEYVISQSQMRMRVDVTKADVNFLYYYFSSNQIVEKIKNLVSSSGVPHINLTILRNFEVPDLPLDEQCKIADTLSRYDDLIANNRRRMALLEESARLLFREWFVYFRFPGHERVKILDGVPEGWEKCLLSDVAEVNRESIGKNYDGEIEYVDIASVSPGAIHETTTVDIRDAPSRARRKVSHGDVIWSCVRPNRRSHAMVMHPAENLIVSTGFAVLTPVSVPSSYLYFFTTTDAFVGYLSSVAKGAAYPAVVAKDFEQARITKPSESLLEEFDRYCSPVFEQIHRLRNQTHRLQAARDLLLPRLMSGEVDV